MLTWYGYYSMRDVLEMTYEDRKWFADRLIRQAKTDAANARRGR